MAARGRLRARTGQRRWTEPCAQVGAAVGLRPDEIHAACTPEDKAALVAAGPGPTIFVGDGINHLPAIVRAESGIAATDASTATIALADVVIARGGSLQSPVPSLFRGAHAGSCARTFCFGSLQHPCARPCRVRIGAAGRRRSRDDS